MPDENDEEHDDDELEDVDEELDKGDIISSLEMFIDLNFGLVCCWLS